MKQIHIYNQNEYSNNRREAKDILLQGSSDGTSWISNTSEKTKNLWNDFLAGVKQYFRTISR